MNKNPGPNLEAAKLRRHAEKTFQKLLKKTFPKPEKLGRAKREADTQRLLQELQVHQIELQMQNAELQEGRERMEALLEKYTDLYDFAPVSYFSLNEQGEILEANLTGASLLGIARSKLMGRRMFRSVASTSRGAFLEFLRKVFAGSGKQSCELALQNEDGAIFWADFQAAFSVSPSDLKKVCRVAVSDVSALKRAEETQRSHEAVMVVNLELKQEIGRRQEVEDALKKSERKQIRMLEQSHHSQEQLRHLARQVLVAQERERKEISRELHDQIAQTLTGINVHLEALSQEATVNIKGLKQKIASTQELVEKSVDIVHRFARDLRPTVLDDLGLIPALHTYMKEFTQRTKVHIAFTAFAGVEQLDNDRRIVLYRVAQSALTNIHQHANARHVRVSIQKFRSHICMEIRDDGKAFNVEEVMFAKRHQRLGLLGMRERVEMVGGHFKVVSVPGKGTTVVAQIPIRDVER